MKKSPAWNLLKRGIRVGLSIFHFPQEEYDVVFPNTSRILMMLRHNGEIHQIVVGEILHIMSMVHRAIMHLSLTNLLYGIIIMESSCAAYHIDNLAVALMGMKTC